MKVVTYNSRYDCEADGINRFEYRKPFILEKIEQEKPDVIGFQEVLPEMLLWYKEALKDYTVLGCGRCEDLTSETAAVAYKKTRFNLIQMETFSFQIQTFTVLNGQHIQLLFTQETMQPTFHSELALVQKTHRYKHMHLLTM